MTYQAPALEKGLDILERLAGEEDGLTIAQVARELGRSHNELYRMVLVLERRGYLVRSASDRLRTSGKLFDLAMARAPHRNLHDAALPVMHRLARALWQSCHLAVVSESDIVVVARVESPDLLGFAVRVGYRRPLVRSTSGRILYAHLSADARANLDPRLLAVIGSSAEWASFQSDSQRAKSEGFFSGPSAHIASIIDIGAPVIDARSGDALASLTVPWVSGSGPRARLSDAIEAVRSAAIKIAQGLEA